MITNDLTQKYYSFFVHFNPFVRFTEWDIISENVQKYFIDFMNENDYGNDVISTTFNFFVEKEVDFNKQFDNIATGSYFGIPKTARLNLHFDHNYFISISDENKYLMTLNAILYLLEYWCNNLIIPKDTPLKDIVNGYKNKLLNDNIYSEVFIEKYIKFKNQFRFKFMKHYFYGINENDVLFDTNDIEKYFNNNLYKYDFGQSVKKMYFSYDIFDFDNQGYKQYIDNDKKYSYGKQKDLAIMEQYDSKLFYGESKYEQIKYLHRGLLTSIDRIEQMKRKPKDFNYKKFYEIIDKLMNEYTEENV
jgi:hypothetical protein